MSDGIQLLLPAPPPEAHRPPRSPLLTACVVLIAAQLVVAAAALVGRGGGSTQAIGSLAAVADDTAAVQSLRFDCVMTMHGAGLPTQSVEIIHGERVGGTSHYVFDGGQLLAMTGAPDAGDAVIEMYSDGTQLLVRAPLFQSIGATGGTFPTSIGPLASLGDRWGRVDLAGVGLDPERVAALGGSQGLSFESSLELLRDAGSAPAPAGQGDVHGVPVDLYDSTTTFGDMLQAQGQDASDVAAAIPSQGGVDMQAVMDALLSTELDLRVAVDDQGRLRRLGFSFGGDTIAAVARQMGAPDAVDDELAGSDFGLEVAFELYDLDDPTITVTPPAVTDAVDLTDWARSFGG